MQNEVINDNKLQWYDYGARNYDRSLGRFFNVDPLGGSSSQIDISLYAYAWNNPINMIDPDGMHAERSDEQTKARNLKRHREALHYTDLGAGASIMGYFGNGTTGVVKEIAGKSEGSKAKSTTQEDGEVNEDDSGDGITENGNGTMTVTTSGISLTYESISSDSDLNKVLFTTAAAYTPQASEWLSRNATIQRKVLIEDFGQVVVRNKFFARGLANLSNYSRGFGPITDAAFTSYDTYQVINGKMSASKYIYNIVGLGSSFYVAATVSNPAGAFVGTLFGLGSVLYDSAFDIKEHIINNAPSINFNSGFCGH